MPPGDTPRRPARTSTRPSPSASQTPSARKRKRSALTPSPSAENSQRQKIGQPQDCTNDKDPAVGQVTDLIGIPTPLADSCDDRVGAGRSYFEAHRGAVATSNLTLASLHISSPEELALALLSYKDPLKPKLNEINNLRITQFNKWRYFLDTGHSLLIHGMGSKKLLLDDFGRHLSSSSDVVLFDGFNPTCTLRTALTQVANQVLSLKTFAKRSLLDYADAIRDALAASKGTIITLVINNIDGPALRPTDAQLALSRLAALPRLRIVASIDHVNAALLWDAPMYTSFAWLWVRCHTFRPYDIETFFSSKPLLRGGAERRVEGAVAFLNSLAERARAVFRELASRQMRALEDGAVVRTTFNELFAAVKEQFLVSDPDTLRNILNELHTHDLLTTRRGADAAEQLSITLQRQQLDDVLKQIGPAV